jgi:hypothetical protein
MKKSLKKEFIYKIIILVAVMLLVGSARALTITETPFDNVIGRNEAHSGVSHVDTLQRTHPDHLHIESMVWDVGTGGWVETDGPMWGGVTTANALKDAGSDWWAYGGFTTIGLDSGAGYIDYRWKDDYEGGSAFDGWVLDSISILVGIQDNALDRVNYRFKIEVLSHDWQTWTTLDMSDEAGQQDWLIGGSDTVGVGTKIEITGIDIDDFRGVRIISEPGWQAAFANDGTPISPIWGSTLVSEVDINLVPEPATLALADSL